MEKVFPLLVIVLTVGLQYEAQFMITFIILSFVGYCFVGFLDDYKITAGGYTTPIARLLINNCKLKQRFITALLLQAIIDIELQKSSGDKVDLASRLTVTFEAYNSATFLSILSCIVM